MTSISAFQYLTFLRSAVFHTYKQLKVGDHLNIKMQSLVPDIVTDENVHKYETIMEFRLKSLLSSATPVQKLDLLKLLPEIRDDARPETSYPIIRRLTDAEIYL